MYRVIPDEQPLIEETLRELCDVEGCSLVVTTGGTGPAPRDVTPQATEAVGGGAAVLPWALAVRRHAAGPAAKQRAPFLPAHMPCLPACLPCPAPGV